MILLKLIHKAHDDVGRVARPVENYTDIVKHELAAVPFTTLNYRHQSILDLPQGSVKSKIYPLHTPQTWL